MIEKDYAQYGISKKRFKQILDEILSYKVEDLRAIINTIDPGISQYLMEHIYYNTSFDKLCDLYLLTYGESIPYSKSSFYRKKRLLFHIVDKKMKED